MEELGPSLFNNPVVISSGIGGLIAVLVILLGYRVLMRLGDTIREFNKGQIEAARMVSDTVDKALDTLHEDKIMLIRAMDHLTAKIDILMERTARTWEQVAIHRGVSEPPMTGVPPAIITPMRQSQTLIEPERGESL